MLNTTVSTKLNLNSPASGIIQKSHPKSVFRNMHNRSNLANKIFEDKYEKCDDRFVVLQVLLMSNDWLMVELVKEDDFNPTK